MIFAQLLHTGGYIEGHAGKEEQSCCGQAAVDQGCCSICAHLKQCVECQQVHHRSEASWNEAAATWLHRSLFG